MGIQEVDLPRLARPVTLTEAVVNYVRDGVISGQYAPGEQLVDTTLAESLGTSRGTVREAMRALADTGLIEIHPYRGAFVADVTTEQVLETYTLRAVLEGYAARLAVERGNVDEAGIAQVEAALEDLVAALESGQIAAITEADMRFHKHLSALCRHRILQEHLLTLRVHTRRFITLSTVHKASLLSDAESHRRLVEILRARDAASIEQAVRDHIEVAGRQLLANIAAHAFGGVLQARSDGLGPDRPAPVSSPTVA